VVLVGQLGLLALTAEIVVVITPKVWAAVLAAAAVSRGLRRRLALVAAVAVYFPVAVVLDKPFGKALMVAMEEALAVQEQAHMAMTIYM